MTDQPPGSESAISAPVRRVAVLGTGKMGSTLATRLSELGVDVQLWDRTASRAEALGIGTVHAHPIEAARAAPIVLSSLTGLDAILATYLGPVGALAGGRGKVFVEMSTAGPGVVDALGSHVEEAGARLVGAPILGAPPIVGRGEATILAGGAAEEDRKSVV